MKGCWFALLVIGFFAARGSAQQIIPLELGSQEFPQDRPQRLFIYISLNDGPVEKYLFDTGSGGFNAAYYDGPYHGAGPNPAYWTNSGTIAAGLVASYGRANDGFSYHLNEVKVQKIAFYDGSNIAAGPAAVFSWPAGFHVGQVVARTDDGQPNRIFATALQEGQPPEHGIYGTFGAGAFTRIMGEGASSVVNGSILGQATTTGWVISANGPSPCVILGLNDAVRAQFSSTVPWTAAGEPFPNSNAHATTEFGGGDFRITLSGRGMSSLQWTSPMMLDTGTPNNALNGSGTPMRLYEKLNPPRLDAGYVVTTAAIPPNSGNYSFTATGMRKDPPTYNVTVRMTGTTSVLGIGFFLHNSVAFDLENRRTLYTAGAVVLPR